MNSPEKQDKLAVLIDADNASAAAVSGLFAEIAKLGIASVKRIYGDWSRPKRQGWKKDVLLRHALMPVQQFAYTTGKDATDMKLIIDAMDLLYSGTFDGFCLVSSDSDFTPLAARIRANGLTVYGFGRRNTPEAFRQSCDRFFYLENLQETTAAEEGDKSTAANAATAPPVRKFITEALRQLLNKAVKDCIDDTTGWAFVGHIGTYLRQTQSDFDTRSFGYDKLSSLLKALGGLQFRHDDASRMYCRRIPYSDLLKLLSNDAMPKFRNKDGWARIHALETYLASRWSYQEYGFASFTALLETVHNNVEIRNDSVRLKQTANSPETGE
jgi:hypothetical protein